MTLEKSNIKKLHKLASKLWKEACFKRDGRECQVKKHFSGINILHSTILQVDHCFTRANKNLFYDIRNGTVVCKNCNNAKHWDNKSVGRAIDDIVRLREGDEAFIEMRKIDEAQSPNVNLNKVS